jgi:hypothetical protein
MDRETRIKTCRHCGGSGEQIDLSTPDGVRDCRGCPGSTGERRVPITRELVSA